MNTFLVHTDEFSWLFTAVNIRVHPSVSSVVFLFSVYGFRDARIFSPPSATILISYYP